jgi:hypothetical protein
VIALAGNWMVDKLGKFTTEAFTAQLEPRDDLADDLLATSPISQ